MRKLLLVLLLCCGTTAAHATAQRYWQQHVSYDIRAELLDSIHTLNGDLKVVYTNNSPDTLTEVYFHLYANAFQPGSLMDERSRAIESRPILDRIKNLPESEWGKYWINNIQVNDHPASFTITGTIMRVALPMELAPGQSVMVSFPFREQIPRQIRRSGWRSREGVDYSMSQWYPKLAEYDQEGWQIQEYVAREFYGVWGEFDVQLTLPSSFTVGATGQCVNPQEAGHGYDQIANGSKQGVFMPEPASGTTVWKFRAVNVHDFAWVADRQYVHQWSTWNDTVTLHSIVKEQAFGLWHDALRFAQHSLSTYSEVFGPYQYRNFSVTMAGDGGTEYPQLIMITGYRGEQSLAGVSAHEIAHQWFYGMLGSNETREAFMDEGFTTYASTIAMDRLYGDHQELPDKENNWLDWLLPKFSNKSDNYRGYQSLAVQGYEEPLVIPHDWMREDVTAGQVYSKTQAILSMLQYTLGDSVFWLGMRSYFAEWHFKHPHLIDFQKVMEATAHTDLDWFFDEWFRTTRTLDYEAIDVRSEPSGNGYTTSVRLKNEDLAVMPVDLMLHYDDGTVAAATIPLATHKHEAYHKSDATMFFPGWDWTSPFYHDTLTTPKRVSWFEIDTSLRLQDLRWLNNYSDRSAIWWPKGYWVLWKQLFALPPLDGYYSVVRPIVWYNYQQGIQLGAGSKFGMNNDFTGDLKLIVNTKPVRYAERLYNLVDPMWYDYLDGSLTYSTPVDWFGRLSSIRFDASKIEGISTLRLAINKTFRPEYLYLGATHSATLYVEDQRLLNDAFPTYHKGWQHGATQVAGIRYTIASEDAMQHFELAGETELAGSDERFAKAQAKYEINFPILFQPSKVRFTAGTATHYIPYQRRFWIDRANNYDEQSNTLFRAVNGLDRTMDDAAIFAEGGAGVRGYNANQHPLAFDDAFSGVQMLGANFDLALPNPLATLGSFAASFTPGVFLDAGWVGNNDFNLTDIRTNLRTDAGVKLGVNVLSWLPRQLQGVAQEYAVIPVINAYFPFYENHPEDEIAPLGIRWTMSIGAGF